MPTNADLGGDPPCWAHLYDEDENDAPPVDYDGPLVADLGSDGLGSGGAIWSLPHGGDLDANLVRLDPGANIDSHINNEVDVLIYVQAGSGELTVNGQHRHLQPNHLALIAKGSERSVTAGESGITYLSIHRRRNPLGIGRNDKTNNG